MSEIVNNLCSNCGAKMTISKDGKSLECSYCGTSFLIRDTINNYNITVNNFESSNNYAANLNDKTKVKPKEIHLIPAYDSQNDGFVIQKGVLTYYNGSKSEITIPDEVTSIADEVFKMNKTIKKVTIPPNVKHIGKGAFSMCSNLEYITLNDEIKTIEDEAFYNCISLSHFILPALCDTIGIRAFANCQSLKSVKISTLHHITSLKNIDIEAFSNCTSLEIFEPFELKRESATTIWIANPTIGKKAFYNCHNLKIDKDWFEIFSSKTIEEYTFYGCNCIDEIVLPQQIIIGDYAFSECKGLKKITFDKNTLIRKCAFRNCSKLSIINLRNETEVDTIITSNNAFQYTPLINRLEKNIRKGKCLYCSGKTKTVFVSEHSFFPKICVKCRKKQDYVNDFVIKSDRLFIKEFRIQKHLCIYCGKKTKTGKYECKSCEKLRNNKNKI